MKLSDIEQREYEKYLQSFSFTEDIKGKTFLITGSKGIVGSGVIKWLLEENVRHNANAHIIASTRNTNNIPKCYDKSDSIEWCEFGKEQDFCAGRKIDYIIHAAAPTSNKVFQSQPVESLKVILDGTQNMLDIARKHKGCVMVFVSSEEAYGLTTLDAPIAENYRGGVLDISSIRSCYPVGKRVAELFCRCYFEEYGINVKIIRPTVILGLWQPYDSVKVEAEILRCVLENKNLYMKSAGLTKKCVIYSLDAVSAILMVLFKGESGEVYNATNPDTFSTVKDRAYHAFKVFNPNITIDFADKDSSTKEGYLPQRSLLEDITKLENLGWKPLRSMEAIYRIDIERFTKQG